MNNRFSQKYYQNILIPQNILSQRKLLTEKSSKKEKQKKFIVNAVAGLTGRIQSSKKKVPFPSEPF